MNITEDRLHQLISNLDAIRGSIWNKVTVPLVNYTTDSRDAVRKIVDYAGRDLEILDENIKSIIQNLNKIHDHME